VDILERGNALVLLVDLPGVKREDIELRVEADTLTLEGQRAGPEGARGVRLERPRGKFRRAFRIDAPISPQSVQATWRDGVLEIVLEKSPRPEPVQVRVTVE
jgi:HSP20 family protein